ncbi:hypothetical protein OPV22_002691 [Ensete ventricosum]|uniref:Uncharacterized protein n=1 Tax=Ensete ventricosum TaxID=4639 RepID=A0AAV8RYR2_ENSVE|nr:hypothetical protein OPV22_002691 [Ensete ventricosum]RWV94830.1 hypothetical protein GW17_00042595 [Ensete ventricosum]RZS12201.1 hypothetical protein BHM03_00043605 [Ensete ventricosum]
MSHTRQWSREAATALLSRWDGRHITQRRPPPLLEAVRGAASHRGNSPPVCAGYHWHRRPRGLPPALAAMQAAAYDGGDAGHGLADRQLATPAGRCAVHRPALRPVTGRGLAASEDRPACAG